METPPVNPSYSPGQESAAHASQADASPAQASQADASQAGASPVHVPRGGKRGGKRRRNHVEDRADMQSPAIAIRRSEASPSAAASSSAVQSDRMQEVKEYKKRKLDAIAEREQRAEEKERLKLVEFTEFRDLREWEPDEDKLLRKLVAEKEGIDKACENGDFSRKQMTWKDIADKFIGKSHTSCMNRWNRHLRKNYKKGPFSVEEKTKIIDSLKQKLGLSADATKAQIRHKVHLTRFKWQPIIDEAGVQRSSAQVSKFFMNWK